MTSIGILGSGAIGAALARLAVANNIEVAIANSRGPASLYYPSRDGRIEALDALSLTTAEYEQTLLPDTAVVKAFNNIVAHQIPLLADSTPQTALPVAGDDDQAKSRVTQLVQALGFDPVDAGSLAQSWRFEPDSGAYTTIYFAGDGGADYTKDSGTPLPADALTQLLSASTRADVRARQF